MGDLGRGRNSGQGYVTLRPTEDVRERREERRRQDGKRKEKEDDLGEREGGGALRRWGCGVDA